MMKSLGKKISPFLGRYKEILITYDTQTLGVEVDGLLPNGGGWENIMVHFDVDDPENFSHGVFESIKTLYPTLPITCSKIPLVSTEGWHLGDLD